MAEKDLPSPDILRQLLTYDSDTGALLWRVRATEHFTECGHRAEHNAAKWNTRWAGRPALAAPHIAGYWAGAIFNKKFLAHRVAFAIYHDRWPIFVDHINGDRGDNRIVNLREVTWRENHMNRRISPFNTSGQMGVSFNRNAQKWVAYIKVAGQHIHLGTFVDKIDAVAARRNAEAEHGFHRNHGRA